MKLLILGLNYAPEQVGIAVYTTGLANWLAARGHDVEVVAGQPYYPGWKRMADHHAPNFARRTEAGVKVTRIPHYIPAKPTGLKRLAHHASFALLSLFALLRRAMQFQPDMVLTIAPSLVAAPNAALAARLCGAKAWIHVQDLEVEAAFATGHLRANGAVSLCARSFEAFVLSLFDQISTISPQMRQKLCEKGVPNDRLTEFRNWADIEAISPLTRPSAFRDTWKIRTPHVVLYSGNIGKKQGIEIIIDAARLLQNRDDISFVICGEGPNRAALEVYAQGLSNVQFHDLQPKQHLIELLGLASIHVLPQTAGAADLVLPSKLTNMLASGRPVVVTAKAGTGLAEEVADCGIAVPPGEPNAFAKAIENLCDDDERAQRLGRAARLRAKTRWAQASILGRFELECEAMLNAARSKLAVDRANRG